MSGEGGEHALKEVLQEFVRNMVAQLGFSTGDSSSGTLDFLGALESKRMNLLHASDELEFLDDPRFLQRAGSGMQSSAARIAWFCFVITFTVPSVLGLLYCWCSRARSHRRAQQTLMEGERGNGRRRRRNNHNGEATEEDDDVLSRMEANIKVFSQSEQDKRSRAIRQAVQKHVSVIKEKPGSSSKSKNSNTRSCKKNKHKQQTTKEETNDEDDDQQLSLPSSSSSSTSEEDSTASGPSSGGSGVGETCCGICLEDFTVGDRVAHAPHSICPHLFHEDCIVSWLVSRKGASCPFCRQPFIGIPIVEPSNTSVLSTDDTGTLGS